MAGAPHARRPQARALTNLGAAVQPIVGRVMDRASIASLFNEGAALVTIVGPGGMGKTCLATCFAQEQVDAYSAPGDGGVWFVDLASAVTVADLCASLAAVLGARTPGTRDEKRLLEEAGRALDRRGRVLVVLDNLETLGSSGARAATTLLRAAPRARLLVTSRVALEVPEEHRWPLHGLGLPPPHDAPSLQVESIALLLQRARQVRPDLVVDEDVLRSAAAIASHVEGIPLALELAAARLGVVSPSQLVTLLADGAPDILARPREDGRHASMRAVVADSVRVLEARERATLEALAVFEGGLDLDAADAVCGLGRGAVLGSLETLVAHSLVQLEEPSGRDARARFSLYAVIREHALAELGREPERARELRLRHARFHAARALEARPGNPGSLRAELPNLRRAHATVVADLEPGLERAELALVLARAIAFEDRTGDLGRRLAVLDEALALAEGATPPPSGGALHEAWTARGRVHAELGAFDAALSDFERAMKGAVARGDRDAQAVLHIRIGEVVEARGDTASARDHFAAALAPELVARPGAPNARWALREAEARAALAHAYRREGRLGEADAEIVRSIAARRAAGDEEGLCSSIFEAGVLALFRMSYPSAVARFDEALELARDLGLRQREAAIMTARGTMEQERGALQQARDLHEAAVVIFRDAGNLYAEASTLYYLGGAHLELGHDDDAETVLASALAIVRAIGVPRYEALLLGVRAAQHAMAGHAHEALALLESARTAARKCASEPTLDATLAIHALQLGLRDASAEEVLSRVATARELAASHACDDPRFALRLLVRAQEEARSLSRDASPRAEPALRVRAEGRAFVLPSSSVEVDLKSRLPLARILLALARRRVEQPGDGLRVEEILAAGWPGERVRYDAGANRVYVALAELRKLGLREWLVSDASGYRLATSQPVVLESAPR